MKDNTSTLLFAVVLGLVCAILLAAANWYTTPLRQANQKAEEVKNYLSVLDVPFDPKADAQTLLQLFKDNIRVIPKGNLELYEYIKSNSADNKPLAVAVPFTGMGLWGPVKGVLALEPDLETIKGIRFYQQEETPGLGGEIGAKWFQNKFVGKKIISTAGIPGFRILKPGSPQDINSVDGITAATLTSDRIQVILDKLAKAISQTRNGN